MKTGRLAGGSAEEVGLVLRRAVLEHPELGTLDRINIVTRRWLPKNCWSACSNGHARSAHRSQGMATGEPGR
jgi:hypothetical protein